MSIPDATSDREQGLELALQLMGASAAGLAGTTNQLIDNLTAERDDLYATLDAVRDGIEQLVSGPFMPTPKGIVSALWPSEETVNLYRKATAA